MSHPAGRLALAAEIFPGGPHDPPVPANLPTTASCYDMYLVRFDGASETWATKLTDTTAANGSAAALPAYMSGPTATGQTDFIWSEYAYNGRIAFDGTNYDLGNLMVAGGGGYWIISSDIRAGQTANVNGLADVHLLHMPSLTTLTPDHDLLLRRGLGRRSPRRSHRRLCWSSPAPAPTRESARTVGGRMVRQILTAPGRRQK